jgi:hypothetical protein
MITVKEKPANAGQGKADYLWLLWFRAVISSPAGDYLAIGRNLLSSIPAELKKFLLGESESSRLGGSQKEPAIVRVVHLSGKRWHRFARLLTGRASYYRRQIRYYPGSIELLMHDFLNPDRKVISDKQAS